MIFFSKLLVAANSSRWFDEVSFLCGMSVESVGFAFFLALEL